MELLLILGYTAFCYGFFKLFRIPFNQWTGTGAVLGGVFLIAMIMLIMNFNHPFTKDGRFYFVTVPIVPAVSGLVVEVPVQANVPLKERSVLFRIDPRPFEAVVQQRRAELAEAETNLRQLSSDADRYRAGLAEARASRDRSRQVYERYAEANAGSRRAGRPGVYSDLDVENRRQVYLAADAGVRGAEASLERATLAANSEVDGVNTTVARLRAELDAAMWNLEQTVVRAPADGQVAQLLLRPGAMAASLPLRPVMIFIPDETRHFYAAFQQNALQRVQAGDEAEVAFDAIPGRVVPGRVRQVLDAMAVGEVQASGLLIDPSTRTQPGRVLALIEMDEDISSYRMPGGSVGQVALYTEHWHHFAIIRRILLRVKAWQNYVFLEGH